MCYLVENRFEMTASTKQFYLSVTKLCDRLWEMSKRDVVNVSFDKSHHLILDIWTCMITNSIRNNITVYQLHYQHILENFQHAMIFTNYLIVYIYTLQLEKKVKTIIYNG